MRFINPRASGRRTLLLLPLFLLLAPAASAQIPPFSSGMTPTVIAGTGEEVTDDASRGDGGPATEGRFVRVDGLDWSTSGSILVADGDDGRIRRITPAGNIVTNRSEGLADPIAVVSTGWQPSDPFDRHNFVAADVGDDTVEDWLLLSNQSTWRETVIMENVDAHDVEAALDGYWVTDSAGETVWHVKFIPFPTLSWVQAPALEGLNEPEGIGPLPGGGFLVATNGDCRIRRHTGNGTVVVAGTGFCAGRENTGHGDGGPATAAHLRFPTDVEATRDGGFVFIERERVRRVAPDGTISTLYLTGLPLDPDFGPPEPSALELTGDDGDVLIGLDRRVLRFDTNYAPPATPTPTSTPAQVAPPAQQSLLDTTTLGLKLGGKKTQKAGKTVSVVVSATIEDLWASASGGVAVSEASKIYRLKAIKNRFVARGTKATLKLKVPKKAQKAIKKALSRGSKVKAKVKLTARDGAGNLTTRKRTVKLKR
jgi:hypothetical protein